MSVIMGQDGDEGTEGNVSLVARCYELSWDWDPSTVRRTAGWPTIPIVPSLITELPSFSWAAHVAV